MKKLSLNLLLFVFGVFLCQSCDKSDKETAPQLPPYESMAIDFGEFTTNSKSALDIKTTETKVNFTVSTLTVGYWNLVLGITLAVPVVTFYQVINQTSKNIGDKTWQWEFDGTGLANTYHARLTGTIRTNDIKWEMYVSKSGIDAHDEFLWYEGTSALDGNSGQWVLYHSYALQEAVLRIDWSKTGNEVGSVKYTYVRISDNGEANQLTNGSYLQYGFTGNTSNAFYTIVYNTRNSAENDMAVNIEWSTTEYNGRIKALHYFKNSDWHCWNNMGYDIVCE